MNGLRLFSWNIVSTEQKTEKDKFPDNISWNTGQSGGNLLRKETRATCRVNNLLNKADGVGFEPTRRFHVCRFSRPVHSTALPPVRVTHLPEIRLVGYKVYIASRPSHSGSL